MLSYPFGRRADTSPCRVGGGTLPLGDERYELSDVNRLVEDPTPGPFQSDESAIVRGGRHECDASRNRGTVLQEPAIEVDPVTIAEAEVEQRAHNVAAFAERQLRCAHSVDGRDREPVRLQRAPNGVSN